MATSKLQKEFGEMLDKSLPEFRIRENHKPDWLISSSLTRLELDFYIEELGIAFEVQGAQHYQYVPFFHKSKEDFEKRKLHDQEKRDLCFGNGVRLIEVFTKQDAEIAIKNIEDKIRTPPKYFYQDGSLTDIRRKANADHWKDVSKRKADRRDAKINSEESKAKRLAQCRKALARVESGERSETEEKISFWKEVIARNGEFTP